MKKIHRNNKFRYSLCGVSCAANEMSIVDTDVNCPSCLKVLVDLKNNMNAELVKNKGKKNG